MTTKVVFLLFCMAASAAGFKNIFIFNGFGKFMCKHYGGSGQNGGQDGECKPDKSGGDRVLKNKRPYNCTKLCTTCPEPALWDDIQQMVKQNTNKKILKIIEQMNTTYTTRVNTKCDAVKNWTAVFVKPCSASGYVSFLQWVFDSKCRDAVTNDGIVFGILRKNGATACKFDVIKQLRVSRTTINNLLSPATSGLVRLTLTEPEMYNMWMEKGDYIGFNWEGTGAMSFNEALSSSTNRVCLADIGSWGDAYTITVPTQSPRHKREFSFEYGLATTA